MRVYIYIYIVWFVQKMDTPNIYGMSCLSQMNCMSRFWHPNSLIILILKVPIKISKHVPRFWDLYDFWWMHWGSWYFLVPSCKKQEDLGKRGTASSAVFFFFVQGATAVASQDMSFGRHKTTDSSSSGYLGLSWKWGTPVHPMVYHRCSHWMAISCVLYTPFPDKPFEVLEQHRLVNVLNAHHPTIGEILQQIVESNVHNPQNRTFSNRWTGVNKCSIQDMCWRSSFIMCTLGQGDQRLIG